MPGATPISKAEYEPTRNRLSAFSRRLDARTREFKEDGELSDVQRALISRIRARHEQMQDKLAATEAGGSAWDAFRIEFGRDFGAIFDELAHLDERNDADGMKRLQE